MNAKHIVPAAVALLFSFTLAVSLAQAQAAPAAPAAGLKPEVIRSIEAAEKHVVALAERFPAEKYGWHPEGARSTGEVFMHIVGGNYSYGAMMGATRPADASREALAKITEKAQIVEAVKKSFEFVKAAVNNAADPDKAVKMFGRDATVREVMLQVVAHAHEHLGQLIAYARVNGIVPPWSEK